MMYKVFDGNAHLSIHILNLCVPTWLHKILLILTRGLLSSTVKLVSISFPLNIDGVAHVTSLRLSLRFQMSEDFMFIDEEVYDAQSGDLIHIIG
jgi:hypothetical protein